MGISSLNIQPSQQSLQPQNLQSSGKKNNGSQKVINTATKNHKPGRILTAKNRNTVSQLGMLAYRTTRDSVANFATSTGENDHKMPVDQVNIEVGA